MRGHRPFCVALFLLLVAGFCSPAIAGTVGSVRGRVVAGASGQPVADAKITLAAASGSYAATTDANGYYTIVGVQPDTYTASAQHDGFTAGVQAGVTVTQDAVAVVDFALAAESLKEIARVGARSASSPVQPHQPQDVYVYGVKEQQQIGGIASYSNEGLLLDRLPGVTLVGGGTNGPMGGATPSIRGGLENNIGYQLDGIDATEPLFNYFINNTVINGAQSVNLTDGPGDASKGGSGSGYVNIVTKAGTYPSSGYVQADIGGPAYEHNLNFEFGTASPDKRISLFVSGRYARDSGACCAPPFSNSYGGLATGFPDTVEQISTQVTNDTVTNLLFHFGHNNANIIQVWNEWGANSFANAYGLEPSQTFYASGNPAYLHIYSQVPQLFSPLLPPLTPQQTAALVPFYPGQTTYNQPIGIAPGETNVYWMGKVAYSRIIGDTAYLNVRLYRTQDAAVDNFSDPEYSLGYGLPSISFSNDHYVARNSQNTGVAFDLQDVIRRHAITFGGDYRFSNAALNGYTPSPSLFVAGATLFDFLPCGYLPQNGEFCGQRYPTLNYQIHAPMYRNSLYASDDWSIGDNFVLQPGIRFDQQRVPTADGTYQAQSLQPRIYGALTLGKLRDTVVRGGYGHATTFAPLFQIERVYDPPAAFAADPATAAICGGPAAHFSAPCANYRDELYNAWWQNVGINPYSFSGPQQSDTYDLSIEKLLGDLTGIKLTFFTRRDYDVIVNSQQVTVSGTTIIPGLTSVTNDGQATTTGLELQVSRQLAQGLSLQVNATYLNQFVNYTAPTPFNPDIEPALLHSGVFYHPPYFTPFSGFATFEYDRAGWRIMPNFWYIRGYPVGVVNEVATFPYGFIPNTNLYNTSGTQYCYYVDPQNPGTPQHPNIVGSLGGGCSNIDQPLTHPIMYTGITIARTFKRGEAGIVIQNIFNNYANFPYVNPGYVNNGFGAYGPGSGTNPVPGVNNYPGGPFIAYPSGPGRQFSFYLRLGI